MRERDYYFMPDLDLFREKMEEQLQKMERQRENGIDYVADR